MIEFKLKKLYKIAINSLESKKIQKLLENPLLKEMTVFFISTNDLIFDDRSQYCCRMKCPNYNTRCYCPPYSLTYQNSIKNKNLAIIFAKTYDFSELTHFINNPEDYNEKYLFKNRVFVRRWVQSDFYKKVKSFFNSWGYNSKDLFAGGFCLTRCKKCFKSKDTPSMLKKCIPMPSPEALGIDVKRTLEKMNYYIKFGVMKKITKVSMLFTDIPEYTKFLHLRMNGNDKLHEKNIIINYESLYNQLCQRFECIEFNEVNVKDLYPKIKEGYQWLKNWKKAILWKAKKKSKREIQNNIHKFVFMKNYYFALDFNTKTIFKENSSYDGIEFY
jgi:predicted metal-binding protein